MRIRFEKERRGFLLRIWGGRWGPEIAYVSFRISGFKATFESPSDWHEERRAWITLGLGLFTVAFSFPWKGKVPPDEGQCSGPTYGFAFFEEYLWIYHGKSTGRPRDGSRTTINMPWQWKHRWRSTDGEPQTLPYFYRLKSGEVQERTATIVPESMLWERTWIPWRKFKRYIDVTFSDEVGERTGSWKGGTIGCSYEMQPSEGPGECLRRMERERTF